MKTVYVVGGDPLVREMFQDEGWIATDYHQGANVLPDLICFTGGEDVQPSLYGEENISSYCDPIRDTFEIEVYEEFVVQRVPMVGICRGGQLLNVLNGGKMIQHITGHRMGHYKVEFNIDAEHRTMHEDHHQGMVPSELVEVSVLGIDPRDGNYEVLFYRDSNCLCFQAHPEWGHTETKEIFFELLEEFFDV